MIVKSVGVLSVGKIYAAMFAIMGLIFGAIATLASLAGLAIGPPDAGGAGAMIPMLFGFAAIIFLPIFYGIIGFIGGIIGAFAYNILASMVGGIEVEFQQASEQPGI